MMPRLATRIRLANVMHSRFMDEDVLFALRDERDFAQVSPNDLRQRASRAAVFFGHLHAQCAELLHLPRFGRPPSSAAKSCSNPFFWVMFGPALCEPLPDQQAHVRIFDPQK